MFPLSVCGPTHRAACEKLHVQLRPVYFLLSVFHVNFVEEQKRVCIYLSIVKKDAEFQTVSRGHLLLTSARDAEFMS